jgi:hypothetical protein
MGKWVVLSSFALHAFCNQFIFLNFALITGVTRTTFSIDVAGVNFLYTTAMLAAVPSFICAMAFLDSYNWCVSFVAVLSTVIAGWLRYLAVYQQSFVLACMSSIALGPGTGVIFTGFAELPSRWFSIGWHRAVATGIAVQSAFFGWAMGGLLSPLLVTSPSTLLDFCLVQAILVSVCLPVFLYCHQAAPDRVFIGEPAHYGTQIVSNLEDPAERHLGPPPSITQAFKAMIQNWSFLSQALACALLQAVGYTMPAVQEVVFHSKGYDHIQCAVASFVFIMAGVVLGLVLTSTQRSNKFVLMLFWTAAIASIALELILRFLDRDLASLGHLGRYTVYIILMIVVGACSLGFLNVALPAVCSAAKPVSETHSGGMVELLGFGFGALLTQLSTGLQFSVCAVASLMAAILMSIGTSTATGK